MRILALLQRASEEAVTEAPVLPVPGGADIVGVLPEALRGLFQAMERQDIKTNGVRVKLEVHGLTDEFCHEYVEAELFFRTIVQVFWYEVRLALDLFGEDHEHLRFGIGPDWVVWSFPEDPFVEEGAY